MNSQDLRENTQPYTCALNHRCISSNGCMNHISTKFSTSLQFDYYKKKILLYRIANNLACKMYLKNTFGLCTKGEAITPDFWSPIVGDLSIFEESNTEFLLVSQTGYISSGTITAKTFY